MEHLAELAGRYRQQRAVVPIEHHGVAAHHVELVDLACAIVRRDLLGIGGKPTEALAMSEQSLNLLGESASNSLKAQAHAFHAYALEHLGKSQDAARELEEALPVLIKARGIDDPSVQRVQMWLDRKSVV